MEPIVPIADMIVLITEVLWQITEGILRPAEQLVPLPDAEVMIEFWTFVSPD